MPRDTFVFAACAALCLLTLSNAEQHGHHPLRKLGIGVDGSEAVASQLDVEDIKKFIKKFNDPGHHIDDSLYSNSKASRETIVFDEAHESVIETDTNSYVARTILERDASSCEDVYSYAPSSQHESRPLRRIRRRSESPQICENLGCKNYVKVGDRMLRQLLAS